MVSHAEKLPTQFTLNTGAKIPSIGFGTWKAAKGGTYPLRQFQIFTAEYSAYSHFNYRSRKGSCSGI
ncbi:MAG: hypothetical protein CL912_12110 [Deltaproteobacteria bacterium]|nr:hypothetical protein [Deltaproteobacteria bacterium]